MSNVPRVVFPDVVPACVFDSQLAATHLAERPSEMSEPRFAWNLDAEIFIPEVVPAFDVPGGPQVTVLDLGFFQSLLVSLLVSRVVLLSACLRQVQTAPRVLTTCLLVATLSVRRCCLGRSLVKQFPWRCCLFRRWSKGRPRSKTFHSLATCSKTFLSTTPCCGTFFMQVVL